MLLHWRYILVAVLLAASTGANAHHRSKPGEILDTYRGVPVYKTWGAVSRSHGRHYSVDNSRYYYGQKWQCVEFVKRFYYQAKNHRMPNIWGHAKEYYDRRVGHGKLNPERGLTQFRNGRDEPPEADDLIVFRSGKWGHVAIVSEVGENYVEVIQQNTKRYRERFKLVYKKGRYYVRSNGRRSAPIGWLRVPSDDSWPGSEQTVASILGL